MLEYSGHYDPKSNIAFAIHKGVPQSHADMERLSEFHRELWGEKSHRVYIITDMRGFGPVKVSLIQYYSTRSVLMRKTRIAMSIMIVNSDYMKLSAKLFELVTTQKIHLARSIEEAYELVRKEQASKGVFPPI